MSSRVLAAVVAAVMGLSICASKLVAFENPLSPEVITEAYFAGTGDAVKRGALLEKYIRRFPAPQKGANIASVELATPFACLVEEIAQHSFNYHEPDAQQEFLGKPGKFRVTVIIYFTATYPATNAKAAQLGDFWNDFHVHLKQDVELAPESVKGNPILGRRTASGYVGATIVAYYDVNKIKSGPATVIVTGPDGAQVESVFDLDSLR